MDSTTNEIYSEVYAILQILGQNYINKLPNKLYEIIEKEKSNTYNPTYDSIDNLASLNIKKESISMIALFHLNYWCNSEEEKQNLKNIFNENEIKHQTSLKEKYSTDNLFKSKTKSNTEIENQEIMLIQEEQENIFKKIFNKIKKFLKKT